MTNSCSKCRATLHAESLFCTKCGSPRENNVPSLISSVQTQTSASQTPPAPSVGLPGRNRPKPLMIALSALVILVIVPFWPFIVAFGQGLFGLPLNGSKRAAQIQVIPSAQSPMSAASTGPPEPLVGIFRQVYPATDEHHWMRLAFGKDGFVTVTRQETNRGMPTPVKLTRTRYVRRGNSVTIREVRHFEVESLNVWMNLTLTSDERQLLDNDIAGYSETFARQ